MVRWRTLALVLAGLGIVDGLYLSVDSIDAKIPLICPSGGIVNCGTVTGSSYSRFLGIPVALLGTLWFVTMFVLVYVDRPSLSLILPPLWIAGVAFAGYLIFTELFVLHAICPYCTLAHILAVLLGLPAIKIALDSG